MKISDVFEQNDDLWDEIPQYSGQVYTLSFADINDKLSGWNQLLLQQLETEPSEQAYLEKLQHSIRRTGIKQPLEINIEQGEWNILEGNHRFIIADRLELKKIPVIFV